MLKRVTLVAVLFVAVIAPTVNATPGPAAGTCDIYRHQAVVAVIGVTAAGDNEIWSNIPGCGIARSNTEAFVWSGTFSGPILLALPTLTWVSGGFAGCTLGTIQVVTSTVAAFSSSTAVATLTMTSNECRGYITFTATLAPAYVYTVALPINIRVEQTIPSALTVTNSGTVNSVLSGTVNNVNSGTLALTGIPDTQQEIQAIADALAAGLDVTICPPSAPCYSVLSGDIGFTGNFTNNDNSTTNVTGDFERTFVNWLPIWLGLVMIFFAIYRRDGIEPNALMMGGSLLAIGAIVCPFGLWTSVVADVLRVVIMAIAVWAWLRYADLKVGGEKQVKEY